MIVAFYTTYFTTYAGGVEKLICELASYLHTLGDEVVVLTEDEPKMPRYRFPDSGRIIKCALRSKDPNDQIEFRNILASVNPDVFGFMSASHTLAIKAIHNLTGLSIPFLISEHANPTIVVRNHGEVRRNINCSVADFVHLLMPEYVSSLPHYLHHKVRVVKNYVDKTDKRANQNIKKGARLKIINVGRLQLEQKRQDILVKSFLDIADDFPEWDLHFWGDVWQSNEKEHLWQLVKEHKMEDRVFFNGTTDKVFDVLADAHIFAFPSLYEGGPSLALLEAMSVGLPAIVFEKCDGACYVIKDGVNGVFARGIDDINEFKKSLVTLMSDQNLRTRLGLAAIEEAKKHTKSEFLFGWERMLREAACKKANSNLMQIMGPEELLRAMGTVRDVPLDIINNHGKYVSSVIR